MPSEGIIALRDVSELRQTLLARPPALARGSALLAAALVGAAVLWAGSTEATLVVRGPGRVRPADAPYAPLSAAADAKVASPLAGRVAEVLVGEGAAVDRGDLLVRIDTERLDNDIARLRH